MPKFAANLTLMFTEVAFLDRFDAAKTAGFKGVEFLFPYDHDPDEINRALKGCGLPLILFNTPMGDRTLGEFGHAALPDAKERFRDGLAKALKYAAVLKPHFIHVMTGVAQGCAAEICLIENLRDATMNNPEQDFLIEPLNNHDMPRYFLVDLPTARRVIKAVNAPNLGLQFDAYHIKQRGGDLVQDWAANRDLARHVQIAGTPGRHEPMPSEINYALFFQQLDSDGYDGFVSGEYHPRGATLAGLNWLNPTSP